MNNNVGKNVRKLRINKGLTQAQLSERARCDQSLLSRLENEQKPDVGIAVLGRISDALAVDIVALMK